MRSFRPDTRIVAACLAAMVSCTSSNDNGGGGGNPTYTMTKSAGNNQTALASAAVAVRPAVTITDQNGQPASGISVTFAVATGGGSVTGATATTGSDGVATVGSWTLGSTPGTNTLTASASGVNGSPATFTATATAGGYSPTSNTSLSGNQSFPSVNIPAGVTVTMPGDLALSVSGPVTIAGTLTGNCVNLSIVATGTLTSTGAISNACATATTTPPAMTLAGLGGYHVTGGTITVGGSLNLTNDTTLTDAVFAAPPVSGGASAGLKSGQSGVCFVGTAAFIASPLKAANGANANPTGGNGTNASNWTLQCSGELDIQGQVQVTGQIGGDGGNGTNSSAGTATATGGNGGTGGNITVRANDGDLVFSGSNNFVTSGSGGAGGTATATGNPNPGKPGGDANATGGNGASPGLITVQARGGGISVNSGGLTLLVGNGGNGGDGTANAGNGQDGCPAGNGGNALAKGGLGGSTPDKQLKATGAVGGLGNVTVGGGTPGNGGAANAAGGNGGNGADDCAGGDGGTPEARGGNGGNALLKDANGVLIANGGNGGKMTDNQGNGGDGFNDCGSVIKAGGDGGDGADAHGSDGNGGTGKTNGLYGSGLINVVGNGGNGGDGVAPGLGGAAGSNSTIVFGGLTIQSSFVPGTPGRTCPMVPEYSALTPTIPPGSLTIPVDDATLSTTNDGSIVLFASGPAFSALNPGRVGVANGGVVGFDITQLTVKGVHIVVTSVTIAILNCTNVNTTNPATYRVRDASGTVINAGTMGSCPGSTTVTVPSNAKTIEVTVASKATADFTFTFNGHR